MSLLSKLKKITVEERARCPLEQGSADVLAEPTPQPRDTDLSASASVIQSTTASIVREPTNPNLNAFQLQAQSATTISDLARTLERFDLADWTLLERSAMSGAYTPVALKLIDREGADKYRTLEELAALCWGPHSDSNVGDGQSTAKPASKVVRLAVRQRQNGERHSRRAEKRSVGKGPAKKTAHVSHNTGNNEYATPPDIIDLVHKVMGAIDLDPASSDAANRIVRAHRYYTAADNGLTKPWCGRVFMNPPYSKGLIDQFVQRLLEACLLTEETEEAIVVVNNATETAWCQALTYFASALCFPDRRLKFTKHDGSPVKRGGPLQGQVIAYFGNNAEGFTQHFRAVGNISYPAFCHHFQTTAG